MHFQRRVSDQRLYVSFSLPLDCRQRDLLVLRTLVNAKRQTRHEPILRVDAWRLLLLDALTKSAYVNTYAEYFTRYITVHCSANQVGRYAEDWVAVTV